MTDFYPTQTVRLTYPAAAQAVSRVLIDNNGECIATITDDILKALGFRAEQEGNA